MAPNLTEMFENPEDNEKVVSLGEDQETPESSTGSSQRTNGQSQQRSPEDYEDENYDVANPFLEYQRRERNRQDRLRRKNFYLLLLSGLLTAALAVAVIATIWLATSNQVEPFYVAVDEQEGKVVKAGTTQQIQTLSKPLVRNKIEEVLRGLRVVYADKRATKQGYQNAWNYILPGSEAETFLKGKFNIGQADASLRSPTSLVGSLQRTITDVQVTPVEGTNTYNIRWIERKVIPRKDRLAESAYTGSVSTVRIEQNSKKALQQNPLGLYIDGLNWQKTSTEILRTGSKSSDSGNP